MGILGWIVLGLVVGALAGDFFDLRTWVLALIGALLVLGIYRVVTRRRAHT